MSDTTPIERSAAAEFRREALAWALAAGLLYFVYRVMEPFLAALAWAAILTIFFFPVHRRFCERLPSRGLAALASVALVLLLLVAPVAWLAPAFIAEARDTISELPIDKIVETVKGAADAIDARLPDGAGSVEEMAAEAIRSVRGRLGQWSAFAAANVVEFLIDFVVLVLAMFYLFRDGRKVVRLLRDVSPFEGERHDKMVKQAIDMISVTISSGFVTAAVQGLLGGLAFALVGLPSPILWGVVTALLGFLPFVGAWMVWLPAGVGLLLEGQTARGAALLVMGAVAVSTVDNVLRPALIAGRSQLNGLLVFVSVLGGVQAFGLLGLVVGPLVTAAAVGLLTGYRETLQPAEAPHPTGGDGEAVAAPPGGV